MYNSLFFETIYQTETRHGVKRFDVYIPFLNRDATANDECFNSLYKYNVIDKLVYHMCMSLYAKYGSIQAYNLAMDITDNVISKDDVIQAVVEVLLINRTWQVVEFSDNDVMLTCGRDLYRDLYKAVNNLVYSQKRVDRQEYKHDYVQDINGGYIDLSTTMGLSSICIDIDNVLFNESMVNALDYIATTEKVGYDIILQCNYIVESLCNGYTPKDIMISLGLTRHMYYHRVDLIRKAHKAINK